MTHPALKRNRTQGWWVLRHVQPITGIASEESVSTPGTQYGFGPYTIESDEQVYTPSLMYDQTLFPGGVAPSDNVSAALVALIVEPGGIKSGEQIDSPATDYGIAPGGVESGEQVDAPVLVFDQVLTPGGIVSDEVVHNPVVGFPVFNTNINRAPIYRASTR